MPKDIYNTFILSSRIYLENALESIETESIELIDSIESLESIDMIEWIIQNIKVLKIQVKNQARVDSISQCTEILLNEIATTFNKTLKGKRAWLKDSEYILHEILDWKA